MNLKAIVLGLVGLASVAAAQDLPTLSLESNTFKESKDWQTISLFLNVEPASPVSFKYCFEFQSENGVAGTYAGYSDLGEADADHLFPMCDKEESVSVTIPAGETSTEVIVIKPLKDALVETDEKLWLKITDLTNCLLGESYELGKGFDILIADENYAPTKPVLESEYTVPEDFENDYVICSFDVTDKDENLTYSLSGSLNGAVNTTATSVSEIFGISQNSSPDADGKRNVMIYVKNENLLDYEALYNTSIKDAVYPVTITITDPDNNSTSATTSFRIIDINEEKPTATDGIFVLKENSSVGSPVCAEYSTEDGSCKSFACVQASDGDLFKTLTYSKSSENTEEMENDASNFTLDENGCLYSKVNFDYESAQQSYLFKVSVSDGLNSTTATITINIVDENEGPAFKNESYEFEIAENTTADITTFIGTVEAVDPDSYNASFSELTYSLEEGGDADFFTLDPFSHEITYKDGTVFDFEAKSSYEFNVSVTDGSFTATVPVTVKVTDVNEEPEFAKTSYEFTVAENSDVTSFVESIVAVDPDISAENGTLTYSLDGDDAESFVINESTGEITAKDDATFDYEARAFYSFSAVVTDGLYTKSVPIVISVTDVNEKPMFANEGYEFVVAENDALAFLVSVAAEDPDANIDYASLTYSIENEESGLFEINKSSGDIYASEGASFDYETKSSYSFEVVVSDGEFENRVPVTVNVTNVDEAPIFPNCLTTVFTVDEDALVGKLVGTVTATDDDCKGNFSETCAKPTYSLSPFVGSEANADAFTIDDSGNIKLAGTLDYDTKSVYEYHVIVTDGENAELSSSIDVTINVFNITNKPTIADDGKTGYDVAENTATDKEIACYVVNDLDKSQMAKLTASLTDVGFTNASSLFDAVIKKDGSDYKLCLVVKDGDKLDYETVAHTHKVKISVTDPDLLSASLTKTINIKDVNEKPSISGSLIYAFYEHEGKNHVIGQLNAKDPDTSKAFINDVFAIVAGDTALFSITENGLIKTKRDFDYEKETRYVYNVSVTLSDKNYPTLKETSVVQITLKDSPNDPVSSSSRKAMSSSSAKPASSSSSAKAVSSSSKVYVASSSSQYIVTPESSASSSNSNTSEYALPTFRVRMVAPFVFEIVMAEAVPSLAKQYAVMDMMGHVLSSGELNDGSALVTVPTRGAYVVRVGLGYQRVNVK
jgi:hypothetical protein